MRRRTLVVCLAGFKIVVVFLVVYIVVSYPGNLEEGKRKGSERNLLEFTKNAHRGIIYAPGHDPSTMNSTEDSYDLAKVRVYDVDKMKIGFVYVGISGFCTILGFFVGVFLVLHLWYFRERNARNAYEIVYPTDSRRTVYDARMDFQGVCNLYINNKIVTFMLAFGLCLPIYQCLVLIGPIVLPHSVICAPDPAWMSLVHLPTNLVSVGLLVLAVLHPDYQAVFLHSVFSIYFIVLLCLVLFGLVSKHPLCVQSVATQVMCFLTAWVFVWPPKIAGMASLRDRLAFEKGVIQENDRVNLARMKEVIRVNSIHYDDTEHEDIDDVVHIQM